jgi:hypothetical protein
VLTNEISRRNFLAPSRVAAVSALVLPSSHAGQQPRGRVVRHYTFENGSAGYTQAAVGQHKSEEDYISVPAPAQPPQARPPHRRRSERDRDIAK